MKSRIISYLFYFVFWMAGAIYARIEKPDIIRSAEYILVDNFNDKKESRPDPRDEYSVKLTRHLPEVTIYAKKMPKEGEDDKNAKQNFSNVTELSDENDDDSDRNSQINLMNEIEVINKSLETLANYLPIVEIDSEAINRPILRV